MTPEVKRPQIQAYFELAPSYIDFSPRIGTIALRSPPEAVSLYVSGASKSSMDKKSVAEYKNLLPERISVHIEKEDGGFWAKITTPDGSLSNCYTQAENIGELVVMINDAVQTHFEIPEEIREQVGFYVPLSQNHLKWEEMFNQLGVMENQEGKETTLTLREPELAR